MFLAATALPEFWNTEQEILFLGPWCLRYDARSQREKLRYQVLPSPWDYAGKAEEALARTEAAQKSLVVLLGEFLNHVHGTRHGNRYWRILLGPWLLGFISNFCDHEMHVRAAFQAYPNLETWRLAPEDYSIPHNTAEYMRRQPMDVFHLQVYSEVLDHLGYQAEPRRLPANLQIDQDPFQVSWKSRVWAGIAAVNAVLRRSSLPAAYFSGLIMNRRQMLQLMARSRLGVYPVCRQLPSSFRFQSDMRGPRTDLSKLPARNDFEKLLISALPTHLPTLFLEGYPQFTDYVLSDWRKLPKILLTSVGWLLDEYFKLLLAESVEQGGKIIISQHGGAYGMIEPLDTERHERAIADQYWNWGWGRSEFSEGSAMLKPMPNPGLTPRSRGGKSSADRRSDCLLICTSLTRYPYAWYFGDMPVWHRFESYLEERTRFIAGLPPPAFSQLLIRLHANDTGWDQHARLVDHFSGIRFDKIKDSWTDRLDQFRLIVIDHPQTSFLEALALNIPTVLFWNPELWKMRPGVETDLDLLRHAGVLFDRPEDAAIKVSQVLENPGSWWEDSKVQDARARFCGRYANGSKNWADVWWRELKAVR